MDTPDQSKPNEQELPSRLGDIKRSERTMVVVRGMATVFALVQVLAYREEPYPEGVKAAALGLVGILAAANVVIWLASRRSHDLAGARRLSIAAMTLDILLTSAFVWLYAFDADTALWAVVFIMPLEGAIRFALPGALAAWAATAVLYATRELWASTVFDDRVFQWESVSFRMGIGLMIALVAGIMARDLLRERSQLADTLKHVSRIDRLRSGLVATLAHDVRNPLTAIRGNLLTLTRHAEKLPESQRGELVREADRAAERLERLATDLLDLARLEEGKLELQIEDVPVRDAVVNSLAAAHTNGDFQVRVDDGLSVRADPGRFEQIVVNLATNAEKYGAPPLLVEARPGDDTKVTISFRDHGRGLDASQRRSLFEPFHTETNRSSVGLGLAIVRALVEAQGGEVAYEANRPQGACFRVTLPAAGSTATR